MRHGEDETERYSSRIQSGAEKQKMKFTEKPAIIIKNRRKRRTGWNFFSERPANKSQVEISDF